MASRGQPSSGRKGRSRDAGGKALDALVAANLAEFLPKQRWFGSKGRRLASVSLVDVGALRRGPGGPWLTLVEAIFETGSREVYAVPLATRLGKEGAGGIVGRLEQGETSLLVSDAFDDQAFCLELLGRIERGETLKTRRGAIRFMRTSAFPSLVAPAARSARRITAEQSNTSVIYDGILVLKAFRKIHHGLNPESEITGFLTTRTQFRNIPLLAGTVEYSAANGVEATLAVLQQFVSNQGDGWAYTLDHLRKLYEFAAGHPLSEHPEPGRLFQLVREFSAGVLRALRRLGTLTGGLHLALASDDRDPAFAPEPVSDHDLDLWIGEIVGHLRTTLGTLGERLEALSGPVRDQARAILAQEAHLLERARGLEALKRTGCVKTRIHGDYHLGQTLRTAEDFVIFDFEGEPARSLAERRAKHCALKDVAGMLRSFDYAVSAAHLERQGGGAAEGGSLDAWGDTWARLASAAFLEGYLAEAARASAKLLPASDPAIEQALAAYELDKALYELRYEIDNRPTWLPIPLRGLGRILARRAGASHVHREPAKITTDKQ